MNNRENRARIAALTEKTSDAYSFDRYASWRGVIAMLVRRGYNDKEVEAIVRSKWTRWAGDESSVRYGRYTSSDLARFMDHMDDKSREKRIRDLVVGTFQDSGVFGEYQS